MTELSDTTLRLSREWHTRNTCQTHPHTDAEAKGRVGPWEAHGFCGVCDVLLDDGLERIDKRYIQPDLAMCPGCAAHRAEFVVKIRRWVAYPPTWWRPSTWNQGVWEYRTAPGRQATEPANPQGALL